MTAQAFDDLEPLRDRRPEVQTPLHRTFRLLSVGRQAWRIKPVGRNPSRP
jgi:hypothetical protein